MSKLDALVKVKYYRNGEERGSKRFAISVAGNVVEHSSSEGGARDVAMLLQRGLESAGLNVALVTD